MDLEVTGPILEPFQKPSMICIHIYPRVLCPIFLKSFYWQYFCFYLTYKMDRKNGKRQRDRDDIYQKPPASTEHTATQDMAHTSRQDAPINTHICPCDG